MDEKNDKKTEVKIIDTYVKKHEPPPESTRPSSQDKGCYL